jgi:hypothetical protein
MANPLKGEVSLAAGETTYTLCFTSNAIVQAEKLLGVSSIAQANLTSYDTIRTLLWCALQKHHGTVSLPGTGDVMDECVGGLEAVGDPLARALRFRISGTAIDVPLGDEKPGDE